VRDFDPAYDRLRVIFDRASRHCLPVRFRLALEERTFGQRRRVLYSRSSFPLSGKPDIETDIAGGPSLTQLRHRPGRQRAERPRHRPRKLAVLSGMTVQSAQRTWIE
jgi:hypothetical protein